MNGNLCFIEKIPLLKPAAIFLLLWSGILAGDFRADLQKHAAAQNAGSYGTDLTSSASSTVQMPENWSVMDQDCNAQLMQCTRRKGNDGTDCVFLQIACKEQGSRIYLGTPIQRRKINASLSLQLLVSANRSGIQLLGRVILPYTLDPQSGKAFCLYVTSGSETTGIGDWQTLYLQNVEREMMSEIRQIQRERTDIAFNFRDAYLDHVVLNVYSGKVTVDAFVGELTVDGTPAENTQYPIIPGRMFSSPPPAAPQNLPAGAMQDFPQLDHEERPAPGSGRTNALPLPNENGNAMPEPSGENMMQSQKKYQVGVFNGMLTINDGSGNTPIFVRAVRYSGEKLEFLANLQFNTVWLSEFPTCEMEAEAELLNIWFICPLPFTWDQAEGHQKLIYEKNKYQNRSFNRVIAWDMGYPPGFSEMQRMGVDPQNISAPELVRRYFEKLRRIPENVLPHRPFLIIPRKEYAEYGDGGNILMIDRSPLQSTYNFVDHGLWMRQINNMFMNRQVFFARIPTQFSPLLKAQWKRIAKGIRNSSSDYSLDPEDPQIVPDTIPFDQLRLMAFNSLMAGAHGLFFESTSRLDSSDEETVFRRKALSVVNLELLILEQLISQGHSFTTLASDHDDVAGGILATTYGRLLIPMFLEEDAQYVNGPGAERQVRFVVRGMPDTYGCWYYSLSGLSPVRAKRIVGGLEVELEELPLIATLVMTQNMKVFHSITQRIAKYAPVLAERMKELAEMRLESYLRSYGSDRLQGNDAMWFDRAKNYMMAAEQAFQGKEYGDAFMLAQRAMRPIGYLEKKSWEEQGKAFPSPNFQPAGVSFRSQKLQEKWRNAVRNFQPGTNCFANGDFENIESFKAEGWEIYQNYSARSVVTVGAKTLLDAAHSGRSGIQLSVRVREPKRVPVMFDSPLLIIQSPKVKVGAPGTIYQVDVWLNIPQKIKNTVDGVKITDTNSGDVLAERIMETDGWQKISFQRIVCDEQPIAVQISLTGYGIVFLDDVSIRPLGESSIGAP